MKNKKDDKTIKLTKDGLEELKAELAELVDDKLPKVVERVAIAREHGDLSENAEYQQARDDKDIIDARIAEVEAVLSHAKVVKRSTSKQRVGIGSVVVIVLETDKKKKLSLTIVGEFESHPGEGKVSSVSPVGKALMGKKKGDKVKVEAPAGIIFYTIKEIK